MSTIFEAASRGTLLTPTDLDRYRQNARGIFDIDALDWRERTALSYGAFRGHVGVVGLLATEGADVNRLCKSQRTALWYAASGSMKRQNRSAIINMLLDKGAAIDAPSSDGTTPLMKVVQDQREPEIVSLLVDRGASTTLRKNGNGFNAEEMAQRTGDPKLVRALLPKSQRSSNRYMLIHKIIGYVRLVVKRVNNFISNIVPDRVKKLFGIAVIESQEITEEIQTPQIPGVQTSEEFKESIKLYLKATGLSQFFSENDGFLQAVADRAAQLRDDPSNPLKTADDLRNLTKIAMYQPVIYCDDSSSMWNGTRAQDQVELVKRISRISTRLVPDGYGSSLQFINYDRQPDDNLTAGRVEQIVTSVRPNGSTPIGTNLKKKILEPLLYDVIRKGERLQRPLLISIITDGDPTAEDPDTFKKTVMDCIQFLESHGYEDTAVRFQISQIGDDSKANKFLKGLREDGKLSDVLYCSTQKLDEEYRKLRRHDEDLERWLLKTLLPPTIEYSD